MHRNRIADIIKKEKSKKNENAFYKDEYQDEFECDICCVEFELREDISILACSDKHIYHDDCINQWI